MMLRIFALLAVLALAACGGSQSTGAPSTPQISTSFVRVLQQPNTGGAVYQFSVKNTGKLPVDQTLLHANCMSQTAKNARLAPNSTSTVEVVVNPACQMATFDEGYHVPGTAADRLAVFTFDFGKFPTRGNFLAANGHGWNGLCGVSTQNASLLAAGFRVFEGTAPVPGCSATTAATRPRAATFDLKIENNTNRNVTIQTFPKDAYCILDSPNGKIEASSSATYTLKTNPDGVVCADTANFLTGIRTGTGSVVAYIDWTFQAPNTIKLQPDAYYGFCSHKYSETRVVFFPSRSAGRCP